MPRPKSPRRRPAGLPILTALSEHVPASPAYPMCLAIPMQITAIDGFNAECEAKGATRTVSLFLLPPPLPEVGDFIAVQTGYAVRVVDQDEARAAWELFDQILAEMKPA